MKYPPSAILTGAGFVAAAAVGTWQAAVLAALAATVFLGTRALSQLEQDKSLRDDIKQLREAHGAVAVAHDTLRKEFDDYMRQVKNRQGFGR